MTTLMVVQTSANYQSKSIIIFKENYVAELCMTQDSAFTDMNSDVGKEQTDASIQFIDAS